MADYIEREAARPDGFCEGVSCQECPFLIDPIKGGCKVDEHIRALPAADVVERKRGTWVGFPESFKFEHIYDRDAIVCPFCEESWNVVDNDTERFNFCPNCGADMRGEENAG